MRRSEKSFLLLFLIAVFGVLNMGFLGAQSAIEQYQAGQSAFSRDELWNAADYYRDALRINPKYQEAYQGLAETYFALGQYDEAYRQIQEALKLGRLSTSVNLSYGRILYGQSRTEEGLAVFQQMLEREPKNQGALFGLAEYQVMKGRLEQASSQFEALRRADPSNLRAILSLLYLAEDRKDFRSFQQIFQEALKYQSSDPRVHLVGARYYYSRRDLTSARRELDWYLKLAPDGLEGRLLEARLLLDEGKPSQAVQELDNQVLKNARHGAKDPRAWYLRGWAESDLGQTEPAASAYRMAIGFDPDNESYNMALENLLLQKTQTDDPLRPQIAKAHFDLANQLKTKNYMAQALAEYRRGLILSPLDVNARLARFDIWKGQGLKTSGLQELETIAQNKPDYKGTRFLDELEIQRSLYQDSQPAQWGLKLTDLDALDSSGTSRLFRPFRVAMYYTLGDSNTAEFRGERTFSQFFASETQASRLWDLAGDPQLVSGYNEAFQRARDGDTEYFMMLGFKQGVRDFSGRVDLYLTRTGRLVQSFTVYTKGLRYLTNGLRELSQDALSIFPLRGSVVRRDGKSLLLNLGRRDGITPGQDFIIVRDGAGEWTGDAFWFSVSDADKIGNLKVTKADDWTSEGTLEKTGFFDTIDTGDLAVFVKHPPKGIQAQPLPVSSQLQRSILGLRS